MKNIILIDDEPLARQLVLECLQAHTGFQVVQECNDGFEGLKAIAEHKPDLVILDIQMPRINGFEMLELLEEPPAIIFTTAFDEYALKAFEANAVDYLLKPFSQERFDLALQRATTRLAGQQALGNLLEQRGKSEDEMHRIVLRHQGQIRILPVQDVLYLEAWDDYVKIHTAEGVFVKKQTLGWYEKALNPNDFVRVHRSFMVQTARISAIHAGSNDTYELRLSSGMHVPASRSGYQRLKEVMKL